MIQRTIVTALLCALAACGGARSGAPAQPAPAPAGDPDAQFGPLEIGADWASFSKVSKDKFMSPTHGNRFVEVYVNQTALAAYTSEEPFPVGSVLVKKSWENDDGQASATEGPIFVMEKRAAGFSPDHEDWYYAIHWEKPSGPGAKTLTGPIYWRSPSAKVGYCFKCHDNYDRSVGLPPADMRTWAAE